VLGAVFTEEAVPDTRLFIGLYTEQFSGTSTRQRPIHGKGLRMMQLLFLAVSFCSQPGPVPAADATRVSATGLIADFHDNDAAVDEYYLEKQLVVTGTVWRITRDYSPQTVKLAKDSYYAMEMDLDDVGKRTSMTLVLLFDKAHRKQLAELGRGSSVTVTGICKRLGRSVTVEVVNCRLVTEQQTTPEVNFPVPAGLPSLPGR
jgi:hypothetical protein